MKRFAVPILVPIGRSIVGGSPEKPNPSGQLPLRASDRGYINKVDEHRLWRQAEDESLEAEAQQKYNSNPKIPATHRYNMNVNSNGYGMRRRLRVNKGEIDPKSFQDTLDKSQLAMNFK